MSRTMKCTNRLRWAPAYSAEVPMAIMETHVKTDALDSGITIERRGYKLQQAWQCIEDGSAEWRDIEVE